MEEARNLAQTIARILYDKKALNITALDVSQMTVITDAMVIASGRNALQVKALADDLEDKLSELGYEPARKEGQQEGRWIVLDYRTVLVHLFHPEEREFYRLPRSRVSFRHPLFHDGKKGRFRPNVPLSFCIVTAEGEHFMKRQCFLPKNRHSSSSSKDRAIRFWSFSHSLSSR